jgi:hypothetical protein
VAVDLLYGGNGNDTIDLTLYEHTTGHVSATDGSGVDTNILHRAPDQAGYDDWVDILDSKKADLIGVLGFFSESAENKDAVADLIGNGIVFTPWGGG